MRKPGAKWRKRAGFGDGEGERGGEGGLISENPPVRVDSTFHTLTLNPRDWTEREETPLADFGVCSLE